MDWKKITSPQTISFPRTIDMDWQGSLVSSAQEVMYVQSKNEMRNNEHYRLRNDLRQREINYSTDMLRSTRMQRQEHEYNMMVNKNQVLHDRKAKAEQYIEEANYKSEQFKNNIDQTIREAEDELAAMLKNIEIENEEIMEEDRIYKEKQEEQKKQAQQDKSGSSSDTRRRKRDPPPRNFTREEIDRVYDARGETNQNMEQTMVKGFNVEINRRHLGTLSGLNWLNDEVINFYRELLQEREINAMTRENRTRQVWFTNTFFISKLSENGYTYRNVRRWTKRAKVDIFSLRLMLIPMNVGGSHWTCAGINFHEKTITYYDSMGGGGRNVLQILLRYLKDEHENKKKSPLPDPEDYKLISLGRSIPQQQNCSDCGVFMSQFLNYLSSNDAFNFSQSHMPNFRMKMCLEILNKQLFD
jgi:Ulp1 family protease